MERTVKRCGRAVELTAKEFALLEYLMQRGQRCCSRAELLTRVWQMPEDAYDDPDALAQWAAEALNVARAAEGAKRSAGSAARKRRPNR